MAFIDKVIDHRLGHNSSIDIGLVAADLDLGLLHIGKMLETIHDLVVHPSNGTVNEDGVAAATLSLLAYVGKLGGIVDALDAADKHRYASSHGQA
ncbi:hypothetical protein M9979_13935 [Sphingomonas sp. RP10(2022)]|uniref:Uncharacterized protein n=1 Tax=Sphingomonas liriopis TaxID=2949094 RepID=A0A9X2KQQ3_9SPHN|nr:hypothetical protein [Sphingomonas liriopis]MCP3735969.1 hypothetical protein [Sphingomonas liriopis]